MAVREVLFFRSKLIHQRTLYLQNKLLKSSMISWLPERSILPSDYFQKQSLLGYCQQVMKLVTFWKRTILTLQWNFMTWFVMDLKSFFLGRGGACLWKDWRDLNQIREIKRAASPPNLDTDGWLRILSLFLANRQNLCDALDQTAKKFCSNRNWENVVSLKRLLACELIPSGKNQRVRPIRIGEEIRMIIGRAVIDN